MLSTDKRRAVFLCAVEWESVFKGQWIKVERYRLLLTVVRKSAFNVLTVKNPHSLIVLKGTSIFTCAAFSQLQQKLFSANENPLKLHFYSLCN